MIVNELIREGRKVTVDVIKAGQDIDLSEVFTKLHRNNHVK